MIRRLTSTRRLTVLFLIAFASLGSAQTAEQANTPTSEICDIQFAVCDLRFDRPDQAQLREIGQAPPPAPKSPTVATVLSVTGTLAPSITLAALAHTGALESVGFTPTVALFTLGFAIGPSLGHIYSGELGLLPVRAAVVGTFGGLILASVAVQSLDMFYGTVIMAELVGIPTYAALAMFDIANASKAARRFNERHGLGAIRIQPFYSPREEAVGMEVKISF